MSGSFIKRIKAKHFVFFLFCQLIVLSSFSQKQDKKDLEGRKKKLQKDIEYTNQLLTETKNNKKISLNQLVTLKIKINSREELITTINQEMEILSSHIADNTNSIRSLQKDLKKLKEEYARMVYYAYKNQDAYSKLMFIFAARDFDQAYMRIKYLQQYSEYRRSQALVIEKTQKALNAKVQQLEQKKSEKKQLLISEEAEKQNLNKEKQQKEEVLSQLQDKEKQLKEELKKRKNDAEKLQQAIQKLIADEIAKREAENTKKDPKGITRKIEMTPEVRELSTTFTSNKGKLPWPVIQGIIIERFGIHPHPSLPGVEIANNGIDISTSKGALSRAIFDGEVSRIGLIPGAGKFIIIRHGEYLSVYMNLHEIYVKAGDKVKTKQSLGSLIYDENDGKTELHLEIWKGQNKLDPEIWLYKNN